MTSTIPPGLTDELRGIVGDEGVLANPSELRVYECDAYTLEMSLPNVVVLPRTAEKVAASAGSYNLTEPEMAQRLQKRKAENILKTGAQIVVTTNPGASFKSRPAYVRQEQRKSR